VRSAYGVVDVFEDIAAPEDWLLLSSAEMKTDPQLMECVGNMDLLPEARSMNRPDAEVLMSPFLHISLDRPTRFSDGRFGVLYVGDRFEVALMETIRHHERFMAATNERAGWTSAFREVTLIVDATLHDARPAPEPAWLNPESYAASHALAEPLLASGSYGIVYPSVGFPGGECAALFYPDIASSPVEGRQLHFHWNGDRVDYVRDGGSGEVLRINPAP
jgi:hypothetical protein